MLYLFGSGAWKNSRRALKVGFTDDFEKRKQQYKLYNPMGEMLDTREGDRLLEEKLHLRLIHYKVEFLDEWFYDEDPVFEIFKESIEEIDSWIWENRGECLFLPTLPSPGTLKRQILDELREKYGNPHKPVEGVKLL